MPRAPTPPPFDEHALRQFVKQHFKKLPRTNRELKMIITMYWAYRRRGMWFRAFIFRLCFVMAEEERLLQRVEIPETPLALQDQSEATCRHMFRFTKEQIRDLIQRFGVPAEFVTVERTKSTAEEGMCVLLRRLAYPERWRSFVAMFGRSPSGLCNIFYFMLSFVHKMCGVLFDGDLDRISSRLDDFSDAVMQKGGLLQGCWGFIDGTVRSINRPQDNITQQVVYNGHKR